MEPTGEDEETKENFEDVCRRLNLDQGAKRHAWDSYCTIKEYFTLQVCIGSLDHNFFAE